MKLNFQGSPNIDFKRYLGVIISSLANVFMLHFCAHYGDLSFVTVIGHILVHLVKWMGSTSPDHYPVRIFPIYLTKCVMVPSFQLNKCFLEYVVENFHSFSFCDYVKVTLIIFHPKIYQKIYQSIQQLINQLRIPTRIPKPLLLQAASDR